MASTHQMGVFASALLRGGVGPRGRLLSAETLAESLRVQNDGVALDFGHERGLS